MLSDLFGPDDSPLGDEGHHVSGLTFDAPLSVVVWDDDTGADLRCDDVVLAQLANGHGLTPADIQVVEYIGALGASTSRAAPGTV